MGQPDHGLPRVYKQAVRNQGLVPAAWGLCQELFAVVAFACAVQAALPQWPVLLSFCGCFSSLGHTRSLSKQASNSNSFTRVVPQSGSLVVRGEAIVVLSPCCSHFLVIFMFVCVQFC